jgi:DNA-binding NtrC family response regulator
VGLRTIGRRAAEEAEAAAIAAALERTHWNRTEAAQLLRVSYKTLLNKMNRAGFAGKARARTG